MDGLSTKASELLSKAVGNAVAVSIDHDLMDIGTAKAHITELISITRDYELRQGKLTEIRLGYTSKETSEQGVTMYTPSTGEKTLRLTNKIDERNPNDAIDNSRCDKERLPFSLASHEGGHLLLSYSSPANGELALIKQSISKVFDEYHAEFDALISEGDMESVAKIMIGRYGHGDPSEFMAECFQEYRNSSHPSKYAMKIGQLLDAYFKK